MFMNYIISFHNFFNTFCYYYIGLLEESINRLDSSATMKAKLFYKSCMNIST